MQVYSIQKRAVELVAEIEINIGCRLSKDDYCNNRIETLHLHRGEPEQILRI